MAEAQEHFQNATAELHMVQRSLWMYKDSHHPSVVSFFLLPNPNSAATEAKKHIWACYSPTL